MYANEHQSIVNATLRYVTAPDDNQLEGIKKIPDGRVLRRIRSSLR